MTLKADILEMLSTIQLRIIYLPLCNLKSVCHTNIYNFVRSEVLTAARIKISVFRVVAPCSLIEVYRRFTGACCLHHQDDRQTLYGARSQKTLMFMTVKRQTRNRKPVTLSTEPSLLILYCYKKKNKTLQKNNSMWSYNDVTFCNNLKILLVKI
jgi:hypothetical protein